MRVGLGKWSEGSKTVGEGCCLAEVLLGAPGEGFKGF